VLDKVSETQPIVVWDASEHFAYANTAALKKAGIKDGAVKINGIMAGPDGKPNGQLLGTTAGQFIMESEITPYLAPDKALPRMRSLLDLSVKGGITTQSELVLGACSTSLSRKSSMTRCSTTRTPACVA
jgi:predicted amidohydrolase YtcJ